MRASSKAVLEKLFRSDVFSDYLGTLPHGNIKESADRSGVVSCAVKEM